MTWRRRASGDRGATLIEAAIILPILFLVLFGMLEIGSAVKSYSAAANAVRAGGRMGSVMGNNSSADQRIMERMEREAAGLGDGEIEFIVVWHADSADDEVPAACVAAAGAALTPNSTSVGSGGSGGSGACNVYVRPEAPDGAFDMALGGHSNGQPPEYFFGCDDSTPAAERAHMLDCNWPARERRVAVSPRSEPAIAPDFLGIHLQAQHRYVTGILGSTLTISESGISLLEPKCYESTCAAGVGA